MNGAIIATEIFGLLVIALIMYGVIFESKQKDEKKHAFIWLCVACFMSIAFDAVSMMPIYSGDSPLLAVILTLDFLLPYPVVGLFINYYYLAISKKISITKGFFTLGILFCTVAAMICFVSALMGVLFTVENGVYVPGPMYDVYLLTYLMDLVYTVILIVMHSNKLKTHDSAAAMLFILIPMFFIAINVVFEEAAFSIAALALDVVVVYIMLQSDNEDELLDREAASIVLANHDELTGIQNRLAFNKRLDELQGVSQIGVIFCDMNGLKYTNDTLGHAAGDKLICDFTAMLEESFDKSCLYRISGDEFVVFITGVSETTFNTMVNVFENNIEELEVPLAAVGYVYGSGVRLQNLIDEAEERMYKDKERFHEKYPQYCRS